MDSGADLEAQYGWRFGEKWAKRINPALILSIMRILEHHDPAEVSCYGAYDEYDGEAQTISHRLRAARSMSDVQVIVHEELTWWFDPKRAGPFERYETIAREIWDRWGEFLLHRRGLLFRWTWSLSHRLAWRAD